MVSSGSQIRNPRAKLVSPGRRHSPPRAQTESLVAVESTKTLDPADISDIVARVNGQRERRIYGHAHGFTSRRDVRARQGTAGERAGAGGRGTDIGRANRGEKDRRGETRRGAGGVASPDVVIRADSLMALTRRIDAPFHAHVYSFFFYFFFFCGRTRGRGSICARTK